MLVKAPGWSRQARPSQRGPGRDQHEAHPDQHGGESPQEHLPPAQEQQRQAEDYIGEQGKWLVVGVGEVRQNKSW